MARGSDQLVGDSQHRVELLPARQVQVGLDLAGLQLIAAGLNLNQRRPGPLPEDHLDQAIGPQLLLADRESHLNERRQPPGGRAQRDRHRPAELPDRVDHRQ